MDSSKSSGNTNYLSSDDEYLSSEAVSLAPSFREPHSNESPLMRFKRVSKSIQMQFRWTRKLSLQHEEKGTTFQVKKVEDGETLTFNANAFKSHIGSPGQLTNKIKFLVMKPTWERKPEDLNIIYHAISKLAGFSRYSTKMKKELSRVVYYDEYDNGRVIVRQGHSGLSFYVIIKGGVSIEIEEIDPRTGDKISRVVGEMLSGDSFGELALLHETKRTATIICKGHSEFLRIDKPDFDNVLKKAHQQEFSERLYFLKCSPYFREWSSKTLHSIVAASKITEYPQNEIIVRDEEPGTLKDVVYFIRSGVCLVVREMTLIKQRLPTNKMRLVLPPVHSSDLSIDEDYQLKDNEMFVNKFLIVTALGRGKYFGVGEDMRKTSIISHGKVELVQVPVTTIQRHGEGNMLTELRNTLDEELPTREEAFQGFLRDRQWKHYKKQLICELVTRKPSISCACIEDVPKSMRNCADHNIVVKEGSFLPPI